MLLANWFQESDSLSCCLSMDPLDLNANLHGQSIIVRSSFHWVFVLEVCILSWFRVSFDKSAVHLLGFPLHVSSFLWSCFEYFVLFLDFAILSIMCLWVFLVEAIFTETLWASWISICNPQLWRIPIDDFYSYCFFIKFASLFFFRDINDFYIVPLKFIP